MNEKQKFEHFNAELATNSWVPVTANTNILILSCIYCRSHTIAHISAIFSSLSIAPTDFVKWHSQLTDMFLYIFVHKNCVLPPDLLGTVSGCSYLNSPCYPQL